MPNVILDVIPLYFLRSAIIVLRDMFDAVVCLGRDFCLKKVVEVLLNDAALDFSLLKRYNSPVSIFLLTDISTAIAEIEFVIITPHLSIITNPNSFCCNSEDVFIQIKTP